MKHKFFLVIPLIVFLASLAVMLLWNHVVIDIAEVPKIHFFQAAGLLLLCRILFGRFGGGGRFGPPTHMRKKWMNMSDEDRQRVRDEWKRRCGR